MQADRKNKMGLAGIILCTVMVLLGSSGAAQIANGADHASEQIQLDEFEPYYSEVLAAWEQASFRNASESKLSIPGTQIINQISGDDALSGSYNGKSNVLIWKKNTIEYEITVPQDGLYHMNLSYHPFNDSTTSSLNRRPIVLSVAIDGKFPFKEARAITFRRLFKDEWPIKKDRNGDDIRPRPLEIKQWITEPFTDSVGSYAEPLKWYFSKGSHKISLTGDQAMVIESLSLLSPSQIEPYEQVLQRYPAEQIKLTGDAQVIQAEQMSSKNDVAIQMMADKDPYSLPEAKGKEIFNSVGGERWAKGGQTITWTFNIQESGQYKIAMRAFQGFVSNMTTFRTISIDGKVPFEELLSFPFTYASNWKGIALEDSNEAPYEFYLEKGDHTLEMTATAAPFQPIIVQSERVTGMLREVDQMLKSMTGGVIDKNRTWKVAKDFPQLVEKLNRIHTELTHMADDMLQANKRRDITLQMIETSVEDLESYLKHPDEIPYKMEEISSLQEKMGGIKETLVKAPLQLEQIYIVPVDVDFPKMEAGLWRKVTSTVSHFFYSFMKKDNLSDLDDKALNVWVNRGRDYVNLLQELSDEMFTPEYGIRVKVNLLPDENLLIYANAAGISPDVALGQPQDKSLDFAMRNALVDLSQFPDFQQIAQQFAPGALLPFYYNNGYYALPETQSFKVLFYRKDILKRLGLGVPDTWDEVYDMMPALQQNGYNFFVPSSDFITFIYQNRAEFFSEDGMRTALDTPDAFKGFKQWTELFHIYDVEKNVPNFYQHFRKGDMPIGVADYNEYMKLSVAAPELTGWWGIAPLPGIPQSDGTIARWSSGGQTTGFIYKSSPRKEEAWSFLKWLLSADVQERYGLDLESFNGIEFRWNTANIEAFTRLPWPKDDLHVILEQWRWYKEMRILPGSYFVSRELNNAWNRTVVDGMNYRESLEEAVVSMNREMMRKGQEFGFVDSTGSVLKTLNGPVVTGPWDGVDTYDAE
ncbi:extracellular solute-binding protein [Paenibacillus eucommiae]|nr:extracellular solute-binding protein [Paenibacillus eucommiae]